MKDDNILYDQEAESEVLGSIISNNQNFELVSDVVKSSYFYVKLNEEIFAACSKLLHAGKIVNCDTVFNNVTGKVDSDPTELKGYIKSILDSYIPGLTQVRFQCEKVRDLFLRRSIVDIMSQVAQQAKSDFTVQSSGTDIVDTLEQKLLYLSKEFETGNKSLLKFDDILKKFKISLDKARSSKGISGISTGFNQLDQMLYGWQKSDLVIIAGRPSMGKTAFAVSVALNAIYAIDKSEDRGSIGVFSLEMSSEQLCARMISIKTRITTDKMINGLLTEEALNEIIAEMGRMQDYNIYIDDTPAVSISYIRSVARRLKRTQNLRILIVDYLQLIKGINSENRVQEISSITQGLKAIAKELEIPVLALSQLSRNVESREDKRPMLSDLRESGSIEQDADIVMFIYRDSYYLERNRPEGDPVKLTEWETVNKERLERSANKAEIIIAKHRNGPIGTAVLRFDEENTRFDNFIAGDANNYYITE